MQLSRRICYRITSDPIEGRLRDALTYVRVATVKPESIIYKVVKVKHG